MSIDLPADPMLDTVPNLSGGAGDFDPATQMPPLDLSGYLADALHWGADPTYLGAEIVRDVVAEAIAVQPRSLQREIGPSEVGIPCQRRLAYKFARIPPTGLAAPKWAAAVGTAIHREFTDWCLAYNDRTGRVRYLPDLRVYVGDLYPGRPIFGTLDALDVVTGTVIDLKGLALDTPIVTPTGWSTMGQLKVGDEVFGADGQPCTVIEKSEVRYDRPSYRVTFDDGSSVVTDNVHLWEFDTDQGRKIISTEDAQGQIFNGRQRHLRVRNAEALNLPEIDLPVHPYVLGAWLGDGERGSGRICKPDDELFSNIEQCGYLVGPTQSEAGTRRNVFGLSTQLRGAGVRERKHIPATYLRASAEQRLDLLRGLMDTDGTWNRKRNQAVFNATDKQLAHDVAELVRTLGWKAPVFEYVASGYGVTTTAYAVPFVPYDVNPFWMTRKADLVRMAGSSRSRRRIVQSIESVLYQPTQCIVVDSPDSMFLCGEDMIPTHNCPSPTQLKKYAGAAPENPVYDVQVDLYAQGCFNAGYPVANVGIVRLPRSGELSQAGWKARPVNLENGKAALARAGGVAKMVETMGVEAIPLFPAVEHYCTTCDWFRPGSTDLTTGCPGAEKVSGGPVGLGLPSTRPVTAPAHMTDLIA